MEQFESEYIKFNLINGILHATYKTSKVNLVIAQEVVRTRKEFCNDNSYPHLVMDYAVGQVDKAARDFLSSDDAIMGVAAAALITDSVFKMTMMNFFLKVTRPQIPAKTFTKKEEALNWLEQYKKSN